MKVLLFGKDGQVGKCLNAHLPDMISLIQLGRQEADLNRPNEIATALDIHRPELVINAAACTDVEGVEKDPDHAHRVNADAVEVMSKAARQHGFTLIHYSTDYVFDGEKISSYDEHDETSPLSVYGKSKLAGEQAIQHYCPRGIILRTSWIYSPHKKNFVKTIMRISQEKEILRVVDDQKGVPCSADMIAQVTAKLMGTPGILKDEAGVQLYHLAPRGETSWYEYACHIVDKIRQSERGNNMILKEIHPVSSSEYGDSVPRPKNSVLCSKKLEDRLETRFEDWQYYFNDFIYHYNGR